MHPPQTVAPKHKKAVATMRAAALGYPRTREDLPWGESAFKVREKVFLFMWSGETGLSLSLKLPHSGDLALALPFASPTGYGLGRSGWVTAKFTQRQNPPVELLLQWLQESFEAVAPKRLSASLRQPVAPGPSAPRAPRTKKRARGPKRTRSPKRTRR